MDTNAWIAVFSILLTASIAVGSTVLAWMMRTDRTLAGLKTAVEGDSKDLAEFRESNDREHKTMWAQIDKHRDAIQATQADVAVLKSRS